MKFFIIENYLSIMAFSGILFLTVMGFVYIYFYNILDQIKNKKINTEFFKEINEILNKNNNK